MRALPGIPHGYDYEKIVLRGTVIGKKAVIAAGRAFFETYEKKLPAETDTPGNGSEEISSEDNSPIAAEYRQRNKKKDQLFSGNALRLSPLVRGVNLYVVLGVGESCTSDDIKKSYRKLVLEKHPDKQQGLRPEEAEKFRNEFLQIQEAFEVLNDDRTRRMYDSTLPFDDTIPSEKDVANDSTFFELFAPAFARNERWSTRRPVPSLGSMESSREAVEKFYDFWFNKFETWRDFSHHDEYDLSHAESRDEKRWMEVQNARIRKKKLSEENARIRKLVELAEKLDPRVKKFRHADAEAVAEEKRKRQLEKEERLRIEDEKKKEIERRKLEALMEEEIIREKEKLVKLEIKKIRSEIRQTLNVLDNERFNESLLVLLTTIEKAQAMLQRARTALDGGQVEEMIAEIIYEKANMSRTSSVPSIPAPETVTPPSCEQFEGSGDWTAEEIQLLTRGMQKYPVGTNRRWEVIQGLVGGSKTVAQVIDMSKLVASKKVVEVNQLIQSKTKNYQAATPDVDYERKATAPAQPVNTIESNDDWSPDQQKQLEDAMRKFPSSLPAAERWTKIAESVSGKSKQQCVARFKYIRELIAKKK
jgi:DnaJ family protein C protein 2